MSDDIRRDAFRKFMLVSPMAAAGAYFDLPMGGLQAPGEPREFFKSLVRELAAIADAKGYRYPVDMLADGLRRIDG
ncbi:MAG: ketopantoate reductase family protein [Anaerotruncus massiliensis (ex Togo et al. 2019)]